MKLFLGELLLRFKSFVYIGSILASVSVLAQPANDNCSGAVLLTPNTTCINTTGTVQSATNSGIPVAPCTGNPDDDVWYQFISLSTDHTITLSSIGSNLNSSGPRLQLFSGTCLGLTSIACGTTSITSTTLARNTTYYIRVYSAGGTVLTSNANFNICVTHPVLPTPLIDLGKSFINVSKPTGGTVETGDVLEIRASVVVRGASFDSCRFTDVIPAGTSYIPGTLRILTNEGKIYKQFTDAYDDASDDEGWITGSNITMNLGYRQVDHPATMYRRGRIRNNNGHEPSFYNSSCIMVASYRVTVTSSINTIINTGGGTVSYTTWPPLFVTYIFPANPVAVYPNHGICANTIGVNSLGTETNGTFGSGNLKNRGASGNVPVGYTYNNFSCNSPQDYFYGIANNTSGGVYTTSNTWPKPDGSCSASPTTHRVFTLWDIIGDHTGAASPTAGNPAADTIGGRIGGYMLIINAAYRIDSAFNHTITGLCPNTYYEISCWMRNICSKCGCDSNGVGASGAGYLPTAPGDSSGVRPNLAIALDGVRYYTSGDLVYNGRWVKKGFTFLTGPSQNSFTMRFYNNAPGGGGNDWALDDISVVTCSPSMDYSPSLNPSVCDSNSITIYDTVRSYFNNYTYYKWQRSTNGGGTWTDVTAPSGPSSPVWTGSEWEYVTSYTVPPSQTLLTNAGDLYRLVVATTPTNLSDVNCRFTDIANIITLDVIDCGIPLASRILSFNGQVASQHGVLNWTISEETGPLVFEIEKSDNGSVFYRAGTVSSHRDYGATQNNYSFTDPVALSGKTYYRLRMKNEAGLSLYSRVIQLGSEPGNFTFISVVNPFEKELQFELASGITGRAEIQLIDPSGRVVKNMVTTINTGINSLEMDAASLPAGLYILRVHMVGKIIQKRVLRQ